MKLDAVDYLKKPFEPEDLERTVTSSSTQGPEIVIESATDKNRITFDGVFESDQIHGRFSIRYPNDPEPYSGRFWLTRQP